MSAKNSVNVAQKLKEEAAALFDKGEKLSAVYNKLSIGLFLYRKTPDGAFKVAYTCAKCGHIFSGEKNLEIPYTVNCDKCGVQIWKIEKVPGKKGGRKKRSADA